MARKQPPDTWRALLVEGTGKAWVAVRLQCPKGTERRPLQSVQCTGQRTAEGELGEVERAGHWGQGVWVFITIWYGQICALTSFWLQHMNKDSGRRNETVTTFVFFLLVMEIKIITVEESRTLREAKLLTYRLPLPSCTTNSLCERLLNTDWIYK